MSHPVIVQSDNTLLLEVDNPDFETARDAISPFAELEKSPEHIHTYRISPLSLWNAASSGLSCKDILENLKKYSRYDIPEIVITTIREQMNRYGLLKLTMQGENLILTSSDSILLNELMNNRKILEYVEERIDGSNIRIRRNYRGHIKQALIKIGFPVEDLAGYEDGDPLEIGVKEATSRDEEFNIRDYQQSAVTAFYRGGGPDGGSGIIVLPCGAGKTIVGIGVMAQIQAETLILVTNTIALRQWKEELVDKTFLNPDDIGEVKNTCQVGYI